MPAASAPFDDDTDLRVKPLVIEWEPDSDIVGDFIWPGFDSDEFPNWIFCSNEVKTFVEKQGFNNVSFLEMGDVL